MKTYHWDDLPSFGINPLTGEACAYGMRLLCDLNEDGVAIVQRYFGLPVMTRFAENWNSMVGGKPAVASVMLPRDTIWEMVKFALFGQGYDYVVENTAYPSMYIGLKDIDDYAKVKAYLDLCEWEGSTYKVYRNPARSGSQPHVGDRNIHMATGRTE